MPDSGDPTESRTPRPPGRHARPAAETTDRREVLLRAAERAIRALGYRASMEAIAAEAGITKPMLYRHFGNKSGLANALADRFTDELTIEVAKAFIASQGSARDLVWAGTAGFVEYIEREPDIYRFLVQETFQRGPSLIDSRMVTGLAEFFFTMVEPWLQLMGVDTKPARLWCFGFVGLVFAGTEWWHASGGDLARDEVTDYLTDLIWYGLNGGGRPAAGGPAS